MIIIAIKDMSAGNESIGEMWQETKMFDSNQNIEDVMKWAGKNKRVQLSIPDGHDFPEKSKDF